MAVTMTFPHRNDQYRVLAVCIPSPLKIQIRLCLVVSVVHSGLNLYVPNRTSWRIVQRRKIGGRGQSPAANQVLEGGHGRHI